MEEFANAVAEYQTTMNKKVAELEADIERHKEEYLTAAELVATMYEAVTGNDGGPKRGVVEDVQDTIAELKLWESEYYKAHAKSAETERELYALQIEFAKFKSPKKEKKGAK